MKTLLVIAMVAAVKASPQFVYTTVGNTPLIFTNGHGYGYTANAGQFEEPIQPLQYIRPLRYNNACRNDQGILVPCAFPSSAGASVYSYNNYPGVVDFLSTTGGVAAPVAPVVKGYVAPVAPVGLTLKDEENEITAPEDNNLEPIQSVEKREANDDGYYGGRGYYPAGPANIKDTQYGQTGIKYLSKREAEDNDAKYQPNPYLTAHGYSQYGPANIKDTEYGPTGIKYLSKREAENTEAKPQYTLLSSANIKNIDYGKTDIKYLEKREAKADPGYHYSYPIYSTGYHIGAPFAYYGGYLRGYGCRNNQGFRVPCA